VRSTRPDYELLAEEADCEVETDGEEHQLRVEQWDGDPVVLEQGSNALSEVLNLLKSSFKPVIK